MMLIDGVRNEEALWRAWRLLERRSLSQDGPTRAIEEFARHADRHIADLHRDLTAGTYAPAPLQGFTIDKEDGTQRQLAVPVVRDRVVERLLLDLTDGMVDPLLEAAAYAYRDGLGVRSAVAAVVRLRTEGFAWVLRADVNDCFDTSPRWEAIDRYMSVLPDRSIDELIFALADRRVRMNGPPRSFSGLPQGSVLSPMLVNLLLVDLDDALSTAGFPVVRYADDFVVMANDRADLHTAHAICCSVLKGFGMNLNNDKTAFMNFRDGFTFLGEDFGPRYPLADELDGATPPDRKTVFVAKQGARTSIRKGRFLVETAADESVLDVPRSHIARVVCFGSIGVTAGVREWAMQENVDIVFCSRNGRYQGQLLSGAATTRIERLRRQLAVAADTQDSLKFARAVIRSKLRHQVTVLRRFNRPESAAIVADKVATIVAIGKDLDNAWSREALMGKEGAAAAAYFGALGTMMPPGLQFRTRSRRPPLDVVNSALGYGYALLLGECVSALVAAGLDPAIGYLHASDELGKPALALDLMEEFRPMVVDQVIMSLVRHRRLTADSGSIPERRRGVYLNAGGRGQLIRGYETRMLQGTSGALPGFTGSMRRLLYRQAQNLVAFTRDPGTAWSGLSWR